MPRNDKRDQQKQNQQQLDQQRQKERFGKDKISHNPSEVGPQKRK